METTLPPMNPEVARLRRQSAQRKLRKRLRQVRLLWTIATALFLLLAIEVLVALLSSPRFQVYRISVRQSETLTTAEVIHLMALPAGSNHYRISLGKLAKRICADPRVQSATVTRGAIGTLNVELQERQAICQVGYATPPVYMDAHGFLFSRPVPPLTPAPVVEGVPLPQPLSPALGKPLKSPQADAVRVCLQALNHPGTATRLDIMRMVVQPKGGINLVLSQGTLIILGSPDEMPTKIQRLKDTIVVASQSGHALDRIEYIDVSTFNKETGNGLRYAIKNTPEENVTP